MNRIKQECRCSTLSSGCPENVDDVWQMEWPYATPGTTVTVPCGVEFIGEEVHFMMIVSHPLYLSYKPTASMCSFVDAHFTGNATRYCLVNVTWADPDVTNCWSRVFVDIMERVCVPPIIYVVSLS